MSGKLQRFQSVALSVVSRLDSESIGESVDCQLDSGSIGESVDCQLDSESISVSDATDWKRTGRTNA